MNVTYFLVVTEFTNSETINGVNEYDLEFFRSFIHKKKTGL